MDDKIVSLSDYCKEHSWPTKRQWRNIISKNMHIATHCVKKVGKKYYINLEKLTEFLNESGMNG